MSFCHEHPTTLERGTAVSSDHEDHKSHEGFMYKEFFVNFVFFRVFVMHRPV